MGCIVLIVSASKVCDGCKTVVAAKSIFWHTTKDYVTVRGDDIPSYCEVPTVRVRLHYCSDCWNAITDNIPFRSKVVTSEHD